MEKPEQNNSSLLQFELFCSEFFIEHSFAGKVKLDIIS